MKIGIAMASGYAMGMLAKESAGRAIVPRANLGLGYTIPLGLVGMRELIGGGEIDE